MTNNIESTDLKNTEKLMSILWLLSAHIFFKVHVVLIRFLASWKNRTASTGKNARLRVLTQLDLTINTSYHPCSLFYQRGYFLQ